MPRRTPRDRLDKLYDVLEDASTLLIVMQNNPDPDAIGAAAALRAIANADHGINCSLAHGGTIGRAENAALLRYLGLNTRCLEDLELDRFDRVALVDAQPGTGNVALPDGTPVDIVIDHHPARSQSRSATFTDIRRRYGATSTILCEYLQAADIEPQPPLATALVYGIRSDTQDLGRESTQADIEAFLYLYPLANPRALGRIVSAPLPRSYFSKLRLSLDNALLFGHRVVSYLDTLDTQEMIAETADLLLRLEDATWAMCIGIVDDVLHASLRSTDRDRNAGTVARRLPGRQGMGGGHGSLAGVQIPLGSRAGDSDAIQELVDQIVTRFLRATGGEEESEPLCEQLGGNDVTLSDE